MCILYVNLCFFYFLILKTLHWLSYVINLKSGGELMLFCDSKPFLRQVLHAKLTSSDDTSFCKIKTKDSRLFYVISGDGEFVLENRSYQIKPDTIILFKAGTEYEWKIKEAEFFVINFDYTHEFSNIKRTFHPFSSSAFDPKSAFDCGVIEDYSELNKPIVINNASHLKRQIIDITSESVLADNYSEVILSNLIKRIILEILRIYQGNILSIPDNTNNVKQIIEYIYANYQSPLFFRLRAYGYKIDVPHPIQFYLLANPKQGVMP